MTVPCAIDRLDLDPAACGSTSAAWVVGKSWERDVSFVIGADGHGSLVRRLLGVECERLGAPGIFATFEVVAPPEPADELRITIAGGTRNAWWPLPEGRCRLSFELDDEDAPTSARRKSRLPAFVPWVTRALDEEVLRALVAERMPWAQVPEGELRWSVAVRFERALARALGRGRVARRRRRAPRVPIRCAEHERGHRGGGRPGGADRGHRWRAPRTRCSL